MVDCLEVIAFKPATCLSLTLMGCRKTSGALDMPMESLQKFVQRNEQLENKSRAVCIRESLDPMLLFFFKGESSKTV